MAKSQGIKVVPDPEVKEPQGTGSCKYRTANFKLRILKDVDALKGQTGAIGEVLRKEGVFSSQLSEWRKQRDNGALSALSAKRGRKAKTLVQDRDLERLAKENRRLQEKLRQANLIIEAQKTLGNTGTESVDRSGRRGATMTVVRELKQDIPVVQLCKALAVSRATAYRHLR